MRPAFRAPYDTANAASVPVPGPSAVLGGPACPQAGVLTWQAGGNDGSFGILKDFLGRGSLAWLVSAGMSAAKAGAARGSGAVNR